MNFRKGSYRGRLQTKPSKKLPKKKNSLSRSAKYAGWKIVLPVEKKQLCFSRT